MPGILLPPAIAAKGFITVSIPIATAAAVTLAGYSAAIAPVTVNLGSATASLTTLQAALMPSGAIAPPSKIGINITTAALTQITAIATAISATIALSSNPATVAGVLAAGNAIPPLLTTLEAFITTGLVLPQQV